MPGSYYLPTNLTGITGNSGILIQTNDVSIDCNRFLLKGVSGSLNGIEINGLMENILIHNGHFELWGNNGLELSSGKYISIQNLNMSSNGLSGLFGRGRNHYTKLFSR